LYLSFVFAVSYSFFSLSLFPCFFSFSLFFSVSEVIDQYLYIGGGEDNIHATNHVSQEIWVTPIVYGLSPLPPTPVPPPTPTPIPSGPGDGGGGGMSTLGIVMIVLVVCIIVGLVGYFCFYYKKKQESRRQPIDDNDYRLQT
jgi:hypothetical protein